MKVSKTPKFGKKDKKNSGKEWFKALVYGGLIAIVFRSFLFEPFNIPSGSMIPTLQVGDHILVNKWSYGYSRYSFPFGSWGIWDGRFMATEPEQGDIIVFRNPNDESFDYVKRLIAKGGDTVQMMGGRLYINGEIVARENPTDYIVANLDKKYKRTGFVQDNIRIQGNDVWVDDVKMDDGYTIEYKDNNCGDVCGLDVSCRAYCDASFGVFVATRWIETLPNGVKHQVIEYADNAPGDNTSKFTVPENNYFMMGDNRDNSLDSRFSVGFIPRDYIIGQVKTIWYSHNYFSPLLFIWDWGNKIRWDRFGMELN